MRHLNKYFKSILEIIWKTVLWLSIIFIALFIVVNYILFQGSWIYNWERYCKYKRYTIWNIAGADWLFFCDNNNNRSRCINWIKWFFVWKSADLYVFLEIWEFTWKSKAEINDILKVDNKNWYSYRLFSNDPNNLFYAKTTDELKKYLKLSFNDCSINFYSDNDLNNLNQPEQLIFRKLDK